jgi:hypothetical protein
MAGGQRLVIRDETALQIGGGTDKSQPWGCLMVSPLKSEVAVLIRQAAIGLSESRDSHPIKVTSRGDY